MAYQNHCTVCTNSCTKHVATWKQYLLLWGGTWNFFLPLSPRHPSLKHLKLFMYGLIHSTPIQQQSASQIMNLLFSRMKNMWLSIISLIIPPHTHYLSIYFTLWQTQKQFGQTVYYLEVRVNLLREVFILFELWTNQLMPPDNILWS